MATYRVEIETIGREVYLVDADNEMDARGNWEDGTLIVSEVTSVEGVTSVTLEEDD